MTKINAQIRSSLAREIATNLDQQDGRKDNKIEASIWNTFVQDKGGKKISKFINLNDAIRSIMTYITNNVQKNANEIANNWLAESTEFQENDNIKNNNSETSNTSMKNKSPVMYDTNPPSKDTNIPINPPKPAESLMKVPKSIDSSTSNYIKTLDSNPKKEFANQTISNGDNKYEYDKNGKISRILDKNNNEIISIYRDENGKINHYYQSYYDKNNNEIRRETREIDGTLESYFDNIYDDSNRLIMYFAKNENHQTTWYMELNYNENNNISRRIQRFGNGTFFSYTDYKYDDKGREIRSISRDKDGEIEEYKDTEYLPNDHKGITTRYADGKFKSYAECNKNDDTIFTIEFQDGRKVETEIIYNEDESLTEIKTVYNKDGSKEEYEFVDSKCISSTLGNELFNAIQNNSEEEIDKVFAKLTTKNIIKVLTSFTAKNGKILYDTLKDMNDEKHLNLLLEIYNKRLEELNITKGDDKDSILDTDYMTEFA